MWYKMLAWNVEINLDICTWGKWVGLDWWQILSSDTTKVSHARPKSNGDFAVLTNVTSFTHFQDDGVTDMDMACVNF